MALISKNHRIATAAWRKKFKREWKSLQSSRVGPEDLAEHHTDPKNWACGCRLFLLSRFLICKHIVSCFQEFSGSYRFFSEVRRQRYSPFWVHQQLVIRPEYRVEAIETSISNDIVGYDTDLDTDTDSSNESESDVESEIEEDTLHDTDDGTPSVETDDAVSLTSAYLDILKEQKEIGNKKLLKLLKANDTKNLQFLAEVRQRKRQRIMPRTWDQNKHPASMYYR